MSEQGLRDRVVEAMKSVHDPEIPVNIYDLGLIYSFEVDGGKASVRMTLTAPNCPVADQILADVEAAVRTVEGVDDVDVALVWEPKWSPEMMSDDAELELMAMGIDPRRAKETAQARPTGLTIGRRAPDKRS